MVSHGRFGRLLGLTLFAAAHAFPAKACADFCVHFLLDRSGSMWAPLGSVPKILQASEAVRQAARDLPAEAILGLRVYPPYDWAVGEDPGLRIPLEALGRERVAAELKLLNPKGSAPLAENLDRALMDFPPGEKVRMLFLICDSADIRDESFCGERRYLDRAGEIEFHILALGVQDPADREELACLAEQFSAELVHVSPEMSLSSVVIERIRSSYLNEVERQRKLAEERARKQEMSQKTRIRLQFRNTLDPYFAEEIQVIECSLDGRSYPLPGIPPLGPGETAELLDTPVPPGEHTVSVRYRKGTRPNAPLSRSGTRSFQVAEGETRHILCVPKAALFRWDCRCEEAAP